MVLGCKRIYVSVLIDFFLFVGDRFDTRPFIIAFRLRPPTLVARKKKANILETLSWKHTLYHGL